MTYSGFSGTKVTGNDGNADSILGNRGFFDLVDLNSKRRILFVVVLHG